MVRPILLLAVLTGLNLLNYLDRFVVAGILPLIKSEFSVTDTQLGGLSLYFLLTYSLVAPIAGFFGDRFPRKYFIAGGVLVWSAATVWSGLARSFGELEIARIFIGFGEAGYATVAPGIICDLFDTRRRGRMMAVFSAALPVGIALGYAAGGLIGVAHGWRAAFLLAGAPGVVFALAALLLTEPARGSGEAEQPATRPSPADMARTFLARRSYVFNVAGSTAMTFAMGGLGQWMPTFLERERNVPLDRADFVFGALLVVAGFLGTVAGGWLGDRLALRDKSGYFTSSGVGLALGSPFAVLAAIAHQPLVYWSAIFVALFFLFFNTGPLNAALVNVMPPAMRSTAVAIYVLIIHLFGDAISPTLIGAISDASSLGAAIELNAAVILLAGVILLLGRPALRRDMEALPRPPATSA